MIFKYFSFKAWKVMEFSCWSWKISVCVVRELLKLSKQGQDEIQASYSVYQKIPKNKNDFDNIQKLQPNFGPWETGKSH